MAARPGSTGSAQETLPDRSVLTGFAAVVLIGGINFPAVKTTVEELAPMWSAGIRFTAAALILLAVVLLLRQPLPRGKALAGTFLFGVLSFTAFYALAYWGIQRLPAGLSAVVLASAPLVTFLAAVFHGLERFRWQVLGGALLALVGIAVMVGGPGSGSVPSLPLIALLVAGLCAAEAAVVAKRFPPVPPLMMNAVAMAVGGLDLLLISFIAGEPHAIPSRGATWLGLGYLVLFGSIALFVTYLFVLRRWTASGASYAFVLFPVVAVAFSAAFQSEPITLPLVAGGALVIAGVYVGALLHAGKRAEPAPEPAPEGPVLADVTDADRPELAGVPADCVRCP